MNVEMWVRALKAARAGAEVSQDSGHADQVEPIHRGRHRDRRRRPTMEFAVAADQALATGGLLAELLRAADRQRLPTWFVPWRNHEEQAIRL